MTARELLSELQARGVKLTPTSQGLRYRAPRGVLTPELKEALAHNKEEIIGFLAASPCWNCGSAMTQMRDLHGETVWICHACEISSGTPKLIPDLPRAWLVEDIRAEAGKLRAVLIWSAFLEDHLWLIPDRSFTPIDGMACYYAEEIPVLRTKTLEELREIHKVGAARRTRRHFPALPSLALSDILTA